MSQPRRAEPMPDLLPAEPRCEAACLAAVLLDSSILPTTLGLKEEDFSDPRNRILWRESLELESQGTVIDERTLEAGLTTAELGNVGGLVYISKLVDSLPDLSRVAEYALIVKRCAARRRAERAIPALQQALRSETGLGSALQPFEQARDILARGNGRRSRLLAEILQDPDSMQLPRPVVPRMVWPGRVSLLFAREKQGKSTLAGAIAAAVSGGADFLDESCTEGFVLWVSLDEHCSDVARRLHTFRADPQKVAIFEPGSDPLSAVEAEARARKPALIVIDTLADLAADKIRESSSSAEWTPVLLRLANLARNVDAGLLLLHHGRKKDGEYRDSTAIGAGVDVLLGMRSDEHDTFTRKISTEGRIPVADFAIRYTGSGFELASGDLSLDARVLRFIERHPECSLRQLRSGVTGRNDEIDQALRCLFAEDAIEDVGNAKARKYRARLGTVGARGGVPTGNPTGQGLGTVGARSGARGGVPTPKGSGAHPTPSPVPGPPQGEFE